MYKIVKTLVILFLFISCNENKLDELRRRITQLEKQNIKLSDSINILNEEDVINTFIHPLPYDNKLIPNEPYKLTYLLHLYRQVPIYNVYEIKKEGNKEIKKLVLKNQNKSVFNYEFTPMSKYDNKVELLIEFNVDGKVFEMRKRSEIPSKNN